MHTHLSMKQAGLPTLPEFPILLKGYGAVSFFFVLSGFLITYLLLKEKNNSGTIEIKPFYWRRVFRIWPLYFSIVAFGFAFYWVIVPALGLDFEIEYSKSLGVILYSVFAANLFNSLYHVGGILNITWSIAVEEQFYLFWAPLMKTIERRILPLIITVTVLSYTIFLLNEFNFFQLSDGLQLFVRTLQFHYMGIGALAAYMLYTNPKNLLEIKLFTSRSTQVVLCLALVAYYFFYQKSFIGELLLPLPLALLYAWLIINVSVNPKTILKLENKWTHFLGSISYGIYMLHMPIVYAICFVMKSYQTPVEGKGIYFIIIFASVIACTVWSAHISHRFIEKPINEWGRKWLRNSKNEESKVLQKIQPIIIK